LSVPIPHPKFSTDFAGHSTAALLHDVLDKKYVSPEDAADPYAYFIQIFTSIDSANPGLNMISSGRAKLICKVIQNVSWTTEKRLREQGLWSPWHEACVELHCVQDADRLDAIGAFGGYLVHFLPPIFGHCVCPHFPLKASVTYCVSNPHFNLLGMLLRHHPNRMDKELDMPIDQPRCQFHFCIVIHPRGCSSLGSYSSFSFSEAALKHPSFERPNQRSKPRAPGDIADCGPEN
jgi:hypothetical protein